MKKIILISHDSGTPGGPVDKLHGYLEKRHNVFSIRHPLNPSSSLKTHIFWKNSSLTFKIPGKIQYLAEGFKTVQKLRNEKKWKTGFDLAICFDPLAFADLYFFNNYYQIRKFIYYNLDYSKKRFGNAFLNNIYAFLHQFAYQKSDYFFSLREGIVQEFDSKQKYSYKNFIVGQTVILKKNLQKRIANSLVYAGAIGNSVDFKPLLKALIALKKQKIPFILDIYGRENDDGELRKSIDHFRLSKEITLKGSTNAKELTEKILPRYMIGLCPYLSQTSNNAPDYLFQGSVLSAKVVDYIAAGLPVIATKINPSFDDLETFKFGFLAEKSIQWQKSLTRLLTNNNIYKKYQKNAKIFAKRFDEEVVFGQVFNKIF